MTSNEEWQHVFPEVYCRVMLNGLAMSITPGTRGLGCTPADDKDECSTGSATHLDRRSAPPLWCFARCHNGPVRAPQGSSTKFWGSSARDPKTGIPDVLNQSPRMDVAGVFVMRCPMLGQFQACNYPSVVLLMMCIQLRQTSL